MLILGGRVVIEGVVLNLFSRYDKIKLLSREDKIPKKEGLNGSI